MKAKLTYAAIALSLMGVMIATTLKGAPLFTPKRTNTERPNIIMMLIDDQTINTIGAYHGNVYTPNLDRMAAEGLKFNQAYTSSSVCTPSRYGFLTGRYAGNTYSKHYIAEVGEKELGQGFPAFNMGLENDRMNVGNVLSNAGYKTGFVGKYHLLSHEDQPELYEGKNTLIDKYGEGRKHVKPSAEVSEIFKHNELWGREYLKRMGFSWAKNIYLENMAPPYDAHNPEWTLEAVEEFLTTNKDNPFFLQYCPTLLHGPAGQWERSFDLPNYTAAGEINAPESVKLRREQLRKELIEKGFEPTPENIAYAWIDANMGAILNKLEALGIAENTLIIFAADHGRANKASLFNYDGLNIPLIMRWPKGIPAGIESDLMVQNIDMVPTYFEMAGVKAPRSYRIDGQSLVPLFQTGTAKRWRKHLYFEIGNARAVMTKDWKYIAVRYPEKVIQKIKNAKPKELPVIMAYIQRLGIGVRGASHPGFWDEDQLYRLTDDAGEMNNLAYTEEYAGQLTKMKTLLKKQVKRIGRPFGEFLLKGNAAQPGQIDKQIALVKKVPVQDKTARMPAAPQKAVKKQAMKHNKKKK